jgi:hypothetical protein
MGKAKNIVVRPISAGDARELVQRVHYSGKTVNNSTLHLGVFLAGELLGVMQFGSPMDRRKSLTLVEGTLWNQMLELNRMAFDDRLPRNSESRALGVAFRMLKKHRPDIKWILSFSDGTQCGDGIIYRASGFVLTKITKNGQMLRMPDGSIVARKTLDNPNNVSANGSFGSAAAKAAGAVPLEGHQLRYVKFLDPSWVDRLTCPVIPFSAIPDNVRMYRGMRPTDGEALVSSQGRRFDSDPDAP